MARFRSMWVRTSPMTAQPGHGPRRRRVTRWRPASCVTRRVEGMPRAAASRGSVMARWLRLGRIGTRGGPPTPSRGLGLAPRSVSDADDGARHYGRSVTRDRARHHLQYWDIG